MSKRDYYEVLQVENDASDEQIKKSYRKLAHKYHPDRNSDDGAEDQFKEASEAYEVLSDPEKKDHYDRFGHNSPQQGRGASSNFDMFRDIFGGQRQGGQDLRVEITIKLEDVLSGTKKKITYMRHSKCKTCKGLGGSGSSCTACGGYGQVEQTNGFMRIVTTCPKCRGSCIEITKKCSKCKGKKVIGSKKTETVKVPTGVRTGNHIRIAGGGDISNNGIPGDLLCRINIEPHAIFERSDRDIQCTKEISFVDACLGTKVTVPTLEGEDEELTIPPGTQFDQNFRIKGRGVPALSRSHRTRGDQFIKIHITVPKDLSSDEQDILKQFAEKIKDRA